MVSQAALEWLERAEKDLRLAEHDLAGGFADAAAFNAQQAAEKALKAVCLARSGELHRMHDLVLLGRLVGLDGQLLSECASINEFYASARYPDVGAPVSFKAAEGAIRVAEKVFLWSKKQVV